MVSSTKSVALQNKPVARPDRSFYHNNKAFGRFGMRWFTPQHMERTHIHGHVELNWLSAGSMDYSFDGRKVVIPPERIVLFWAGIPHQTTAIDFGTANESRQCNIYLPLDAFLHMPHVGALHEAILGGGVICLSQDAAGPGALARWYKDYRTGDPERQDIMKVEIAAMLRRAVLIGWEELLPPWIETTQMAKRQASSVRYVVAMVRHILENLSEPLSAQDISRVVGLHPNYALNLFTQVMNVPVKKFVVRMRLVRARALMFESNLSIANVAFQSGFSSLSQFYEHFRNAYGITPREMRTSLVRN